MSLDGITQSFLPYTVDGLQSIDSSFVYYNGVPIGTAFVPYSGATSDVNLNNKNISNVNTLTATTGNITTLNTTTATITTVNSSTETVGNPAQVTLISILSGIPTQPYISLTTSVSEKLAASK